MMRFDYEYRTSDNVRRTGVVRAATRDAAFAALRAQGIRPSAVRESPGFFNKLWGRGKRWLAIGCLAVVCGVLALVVRTVGSDLETAREEVREIAFTFEDMTRRQIIGDAAVIEKGVRTGWEDVFPHEGERFLASFAIPGVPAALRNTSEGKVRAALARKVEAGAGASIEARQIVAIVEGMKDELRRFLASGRHTVVEYGHRLVERQEQEIAYYRRAKAEVEAAVRENRPKPEVLALWEARNAQLRQIGVRLVPMPED